MIRMNKRIPMMASVMATLLVAATHANAHYLWIEPSSAGHRLHFGEAEILLKEKSPGRLDGFQAPKALALASASAPEEIPVTRAVDHFALGTKSNARAVVALDESMAVRDLSKSGLGLAKTNYYARFARSGVVEKQGFLLPLDAVAFERQGSRVMTILYRGQPLRGAKVQVIAPNTWMQEHAAQADGTVQIHTPWRGQYVVHVLHVDKTAGEFGGQNYDAVRNHYTLTFVQDKGAPPGPAIPPKQPME
jgi:hypothetical protein